MQLTAAIASDGNQRNIADLSKSVIDPQALQQLVDKFGARLNQLFCRYARIKCAAQPAVKDIHVRLDVGTGQLVLRPDARVIGLVGEGGKGCVSILFG